MSDPIHIISLGAGVQSSVMAIMACHGEIKPMPACAIFADTGDEPWEVYQWLKDLCRLLTFPVIQLKSPKLSDGIVNAWGHSQIPAFFQGQMGRRQCTKYFKVLPVRHEIRRRYPGQDCVLWQGISTDESLRMKESGRQWLTHRFPLIELGFDRAACQTRLKLATSQTIPKSACVYCPYRSPKQWRESRSKPYDMAIIRKVESVLLPRGESLLKSGGAVDDADFSTEEERGQLNMFNNECEGMCGV